MSTERVRIQLEPLSATVEVPRGASLASVLPQLGLEFPCGGTALCGGCSVRVLSGSLAVTESDRRVFSRKSLRLDGGSHARHTPKCRWF